MVTAEKQKKPKKVATTVNKAATKRTKAATSKASAAAVYPFDLPMSQESLAQAVDDLDTLQRVKAKYLAFMMIPVEERIGEWRFAGKASNFGAALGCLDKFFCKMRFGSSDEGEGVLFAEVLENDALEFGSDIERFRVKKRPASFADNWEEKLPKHRLILLAEGGAPHDDFGFAILEVGDFGVFTNRRPNTRRPEEWPDEE